jgi:hypothetical protein
LGGRYLAIDELNNNANASWQDGGEMSRRFVGWLQQLAADGYDRRVILYVNLYNMPSTVGKYSEVLRACTRHCRAVGAEIYLSTSNVIRPRAETPGHCTRNISCLEILAEKLEMAAPGINTLTVSVLGVSDVYLQNSSLAFCGEGASLEMQYAALHKGALTSQQPGVGWYSFHGVQWQQAEHAACIAKLDREWPLGGTTAGR